MFDQVLSDVLCEFLGKNALQHPLSPSVRADGGGGFHFPAVLASRPTGEISAERSANVSNAANDRAKITKRTQEVVCFQRAQL